MKYLSHVNSGYKWQRLLQRAQGNIAQYKSIIFPPKPQHHVTVYLHHYVPQVAIAKVNYMLSEQK